MKGNRGPEPESVIYYKITHNQRTKWLWRDVYNGVTGLYIGSPAL